jgi:hypothetical protein
MLPRSVDEAARDRHTQQWTGDVFRVGEVLRARRSDLVIIPVDTAPTGVLVILGPDRSDTTLRDAYDGIVEAEVRPDPQVIPGHILERSGAVDPAALLAEPFWRDLATSRGKARRRARTLADIRMRIGALSGSASH